MRIKATIIFDVPEHLIEECNLARISREYRKRVDEARIEIFKQLYENLEKSCEYGLYQDVIDNTSIKDYKFKIYNEDMLFEM